MKTVVVYGSLKKGKYNNPIMGDSEYLGETKIKGQLYMISSYPAITEEGDNEYTAEVYKVSDDVYRSIYGMEIGAGYKEMTATIKGEDGTVIDDAVVYYADESLAEYCKNNCEMIEEY